MYCWRNRRCFAEAFVRCCSWNRQRKHWLVLSIHVSLVFKSYSRWGKRKTKLDSCSQVLGALYSRKQWRTQSYRHASHRVSRYFVVAYFFLSFRAVPNVFGSEQDNFIAGIKVLLIIFIFKKWNLFSKCWNRASITLLLLFVLLPLRLLFLSLPLMKRTINLSKDSLPPFLPLLRYSIFLSFFINHVY